MSNITIQHTVLKNGQAQDKFLREKLFSIVDKNDIVLDAGCGERNVLLDARQVKELVGIDSDKTAIKQNKQISKGVVADLEELELENGKFDVVVSLDVVEHLENPQKFIEGVAKILKSGGYFFATTPNRKSICGFMLRLLPISWIKAVTRIVRGEPTSNEVYYYRLNTVSALTRALVDNEFRNISIFLLHQLPDCSLAKAVYYLDFLIGRSRMFPFYSIALLCVARR